MNKGKQASVDDILSIAIEHFEKSLDKVDLLLKRLGKKFNLGKNDRNLLYDAIYYYIRHKDLVLFYSNDNNPKEIALASLALVQNNLENYKEQENNFKKLSTAQQEDLYISYPQFWQEKMTKAFGLDINSAKKILNGRARVTLLALAKRDSRDNLLKLLQERESLSVEPTPLSPLGLYVEGKLRSQDDLFFDVMDEGSQLSAFVINPNHQQVLDYCAGQGGKSVAMGSFLPHLNLVLSDIREDLKENTLSRMQRAGIKASWIHHNQLFSTKKQFDSVVIDAPCSGSGVWRRNAEDKYRINQNNFDKIIKLQRTILLEAGKLVRQDGELVYITCSFTKEENEEQIAWFLEQTRSFKLEDARTRLSDNLNKTLAKNTLMNYYYDDKNFLRSKAYLSDLFFVAILKKIKL